MNPQQPAWFALTVKPRHERAAAEHLRARELEEYVPLYRSRRSWSDRTKVLELPLFPGYVFCRFAFRDRLRALNAPGVLSILGFGDGDVPVADEEIAAIRTMLASHLPVAPWLCVQAGDRVRVERGALAGLTGTLLREKGSWRVVVNVELLQRAVAVEVDREWVALLGGPEQGGIPAHGGPARNAWR